METAAADDPAHPAPVTSSHSQPQPQPHTQPHLQSSPASAPPFHYLINEQAKSIAALQELQNEVSALLEFRDLVMETFPHLRGKQLETASVGGIGMVGVVGRAWEPGVRVRRKLASATAESASSLATGTQPRSRSNSHGNRKGLAAGTDSGSSTASSQVQDSGFCADSSKEHCSANAATIRTNTVCGGKEGETEADGVLEGGGGSGEDELWTLLELIESRGTRLRREAELLRERCESAPRRSRSLQDVRLRPDSPERRPSAQTAAPARAASQPRARLGALDGVVSRPSARIRGAAGVRPDQVVTAAVLRETNVLELRRHLLTTVFDNQVVRHRLKEVSRVHKEMSLRLDKANEDNEDLRFQLEEKTIELEGTRARVRLLEQLQAARMPPPSTASTTAATGEQSSTESAHHDDKSVETPKRRPSRIPLKSYTAPKPPPLVHPSQHPHPHQQQHRSIGGGGGGGGVAAKRTSAATPPPRHVPASASANSVSRRGRKWSHDDGGAMTKRDPPSSPAPERIVSDADSKTEYPDSLDGGGRRRTPPLDSIESIECDSLDDLV